MIDTDKYTGHTLAEHWDFSIWGITMPTGFEADAELIADAPLLLAEVLRLRGLLDAANERARVAIESHPNADEMLKELIE